MYTEMEALIQHFLSSSQGFTGPAGGYVPVDGAAGRTGLYVVSDGTTAPGVSAAPPSCCVPALANIVGGLIADVIAVIGSIDVVMGDVDR